MEPLEDQVALVLLDADTVVLDLDDHAGPRARRSHADQGRHAGTGVLDGVADEVGEELPQGRLVGVHRRQALVGDLDRVIGSQQRGGPHECAVRSAERDVAHVQAPASATAWARRSSIRPAIWIAACSARLTEAWVSLSGSRSRAASSSQARIAVRGPRRSCAAVEAKPTRGRMPLAVLGHLPEDEQGARASAVVPAGCASSARDTASTRSSPEGKRSWTSPTPSSAREAPVWAGAGWSTSSTSCGEGHRVGGARTHPMGEPATGAVAALDRVRGRRGRSVPRPCSRSSLRAARPARPPGPGPRPSAPPAGRCGHSACRPPDPVRSTATRKICATSVSCERGRVRRSAAGPAREGRAAMPPTPRASAWSAAR